LSVSINKITASSSLISCYRHFRYIF